MPVNRRSITIMSGSGNAMNLYSDVVKGDSYYGYADGLHTIQVIYNDFVGRFRLQCTLALEPTADDWFDIIPDISTGNAFNPAGYIQYDEDSPAKLSEAYTFKGNYTFIRVYLDREWMGDGVTYLPAYGQISKVILSA